MLIGIISAMDEELEAYLEVLEEKSSRVFSRTTFHRGFLHGHEVVLVRSGVGKVNAAICAQMLVNLYDVTRIIYTGVAGGVNPALKVLDIVISRDSMQHDIDASQLGFSRGQIPFSDLHIFESDIMLGEVAQEAARSAGLPFYVGRVLSGDQFISDSARVKDLHEALGGDCVEMEGAAVAQVCEMNSVPHLIIRTISDRADEEAAVSFSEVLHAASINSFRLVSGMLILLPVESRNRLAYIKDSIRTIPDFPKQGIMFRDVSTLFRDKLALKYAVQLLFSRYSGSNIDIVAGIESRGFITGSLLAEKLGAGFVLIRKPGKLPSKTISESYTLEYGTETLEVHEDAITPGQRVLIVDDLIATGGTAVAASKLVRRLGGEVVSCSFIVDLPDLGGKSRLLEEGFHVDTLIEFEGE